MTLAFTILRSPDLSALSSRCHSDRTHVKCTQCGARYLLRIGYHPPLTHPTHPQLGRGVTRLIVMKSSAQPTLHLHSPYPLPTYAPPAHPPLTHPLPILRSCTPPQLCGTGRLNTLFIVACSRTSQPSRRRRPILSRTSQPSQRRRPICIGSASSLQSEQKTTVRETEMHLHTWLTLVCVTPVECPPSRHPHQAARVGVPCNEQYLLQATSGEQELNSRPHQARVKNAVQD